MAHLYSGDRRNTHRLVPGLVRSVQDDPKPIPQLESGEELKLFYYLKGELSGHCDPPAGGEAIF